MNQPQLPTGGEASPPAERGQARALNRSQRGPPVHPLTPRAVVRLAGMLHRLGHVAAWLPALMVLLMTVVVFLRYVLGVGSVALQEFIIYLHAIVITVGVSYSLLHDAHVRVDVLFRDWSPARKAWVDVIGTVLFLLPLCVVMVWVSISYVTRSWKAWEGSPEAGGLEAVYILKSLILVMAVMLGFAGVVRLGDQWTQLRERGR